MFVNLCKNLYRIGPWQVLTRPGRFAKTKNGQILTEIFLSDKIIRKTKDFPVFEEIFLVFAVLTLLPVQKNRDFTCFPGKFPVFCVITLSPIFLFHSSWQWNSRSNLVHSLLVWKKNFQLLKIFKMKNMRLDSNIEWKASKNTFMLSL